MSLFNVEIEGALLATLLQHPEVFSECYLIGESDWSDTNRPIFAVIKQQLSQVPPGSVSPISLAEKLKGYSITTVSGIEVLPYLEGLTIKCIQKSDAGATARELKRYTVRRELIRQVEQTRTELISKPNLSFDEMTKLVESGLSNVSTEYYKPDVEEVLNDKIIEVIENRADNPIQPEEMLYQGPIPSINRTAGPLVFNGSFTTVIARTSVGKSSFGFYYCVHIAARYEKVHLLWLDAAEMTIEQLQMRAVCCLSEGRIPLWAVRSGEWRKNPAWVKIIRGEIWPKIKKISMSYKNVGSMTPKEKINFIRRFYFNTCGRGNFLLIIDDYLKGVESLSKHAAEYQAMGYYVGDVKTLVTDEIEAGYWTSLQGNRSIITAGKKLNEIQDNGEAGAGISDRIVQQSTNALLLRPKIIDELSQENAAFGNYVLKKVKLREGYGRDYDKFIKPIRLSSGQHIENFWNIEAKNFYYTDKGLHSEALEMLGQTRTNLGNSTITASL